MSLFVKFTSFVGVRRERLITFSVEKVDEWFEKVLDVVAAIVPKLDKEMEETQHLWHSINSLLRSKTTSHVFGAERCYHSGLESCYCDPIRVVNKMLM